MFNLLKSKIPSEAESRTIKFMSELKKARYFGYRALKALAIGTMLSLLMAVALCLMTATVSNAQVLYGSLTGNITDPGGAVVKGAKVQTTNLGTGDVKTMVTDDHGSFTFSDLQPGVYKLTISLTGFKTSFKDDVKVEA